MRINLTAEQYLNNIFGIHISDQSTKVFQHIASHREGPDHLSDRGGLQQRLHEQDIGMESMIRDVKTLVEALNAKHHVQLANDSQHQPAKHERASVKEQIVKLASEQFDLDSFAVFLLTLDFLTRFQALDTTTVNDKPITVKTIEKKIAGTNEESGMLKIRKGNLGAFAYDQKVIREGNYIPALKKFLQKVYAELKRQSKTTRNLYTEIKEMGQDAPIAKLIAKLLSPKAQPKA